MWYTKGALISLLLGFVIPSPFDRFGSFIIHYILFAALLIFIHVANAIHDVSVAEIIGIAVPEKLHRRGIGRNMIQFVLKSESLEKLEAQTDDDSVGFYRKCGFAVERIAVDYPDGSVVRYNCVLNK